MSAVSLLDAAWRWPVALIVRAPLMLLGYALEWLGVRIAETAFHIPGAPARRKRGRHD